jgi:hypothetical protein
VKASDRGNEGSDLSEGVRKWSERGGRGLKGKAVT